MLRPCYHVHIMILNHCVYSCLLLKTFPCFYALITFCLYFSSYTLFSHYLVIHFLFALCSEIPESKMPYFQKKEHLSFDLLFKILTCYNLTNFFGELKIRWLPSKDKVADDKFQFWTRFFASSTFLGGSQLMFSSPKKNC